MYNISLEHSSFVYLLSELRRLYVEGQTTVDLSKLVAHNTKFLG